MSQETLQQFARQLQAWATEELNDKPGPFRSVEALPQLLGKDEFISPPLVFWINRESLLAGGVVLLPKKDPTDVLESGEEICAALGLDCYYSWGAGEVAAWQVGPDSGRQWTEPLPGSVMQEARAFREALGLVLEHMQSRFFSSQHQLPLLSASYLANLLHNSIESALTASAAGLAQPAYGNNDENSARAMLAEFIVLILALASQNRLRTGTSPDTLMTDLTTDSKQLPAPLRSALQKRLESTRVPGSASIKLHHLYQRLRQLGPRMQPFISEAVTRLLRFWCNTAVFSPLPAAVKKNSATLIINPDRYYPEMSVAVEVAPAPLPAATALLRCLQSSERRHPLQLQDILELQTPLTVSTIIGSFNDRTRVSPDLQKQLNAKLRSSWPNRHLKLPSTSPRWVWQFIHLLGLQNGAQHAILTLPADWLWAPYGEQLFSLFSERCRINKVSRLTEDCLRVEFNHPGGGQQMTIDSATDDSRRLDTQNLKISRAELLLALTLPDKVYELIRSGELRPGTNDGQNLDAVELFMRSSVGRGLWQILAPKRSLPKKDRLLADITRTGFPLPSEKTLKALGGLSRKNSAPDQSLIDSELEAWLGSACRIKIEAHFSVQPPPSPARSDTSSAVVLASRLTDAGAVPAFPGDYLYDIAEDARQSYTVTAPLQRTETFFNTVTLASPDGATIQVEGAAKARSLQLFSLVQSGAVELPICDQQAGIILDRYIRDLQILYKRVLGETAHQGSAANELAEQVWSRLPVPPRDALEAD